MSMLDGFRNVTGELLTKALIWSDNHLGAEFDVPVSSNGRRTLKSYHIAGSGNDGWRITREHLEVKSDQEFRGEVFFEVTKKAYELTIIPSPNTPSPFKRYIDAQITSSNGSIIFSTDDMVAFVLHDAEAQDPEHPLIPTERFLNFVQRHNPNWIPA